MSVSDFTNGSKQAVLDLINKSNSVNLQPSQLELLNITPVGEGKQVNVTAKAVRGSGYKGELTLVYNRVGLGEIPTIGEGGYTYDLSNYSGLFSFFMAFHGVKMDEQDIFINGESVDEVDSAVVQEYDVANVFTITAKPGSLAWMGSVELSIYRTTTALGDVWTIHVLDGLDTPGKVYQWPAEAVAMAPDGSVRMYADGNIKTYLNVQ